MEKYKWNIFICHASEDKQDVARPLANHLAALGVSVWLDESEIRLGDSLRSKIDNGLAQSQYGVVVLSPNFFAKDWTKSELGGLLAREVKGTKVILPVWHKMTPGDLRSHSPILADRLAVSTDIGIRSVASKILYTIRTSGPLYQPGSPIFCGRLTKKILLELPEGSFLMSNLIDNDFSPRLAELVPPRDQREIYWRKLRDQGLLKSMFYVFSDATEFRAHMAARDIWSIVDRLNGQR